MFPSFTDSKIKLRFDFRSRCIVRRGGRRKKAKAVAESAAFNKDYWPMSIVENRQWRAFTECSVAAVLFRQKKGNHLEGERAKAFLRSVHLYDKNGARFFGVVVVRHICNT